jgi:hypothetical protein
MRRPTAAAGSALFFATAPAPWRAWAPVADPLAGARDAGPLGAVRATGLTMPIRATAGPRRIRARTCGTI